MPTGGPQKGARTDSHVRQIVRSSHFHTRALRHVRNAHTEDTAKSVGQALVSSRLDYANSILYGVSRQNLKKLQRSQNTLARVVTRSCRRDSATAMLRHLHWLPIKERIDFKMAALTFKTVSLKSPSYLSSLQTFFQPSRSLRSENLRILDKPRTKTAAGARAFCCAARTVWNSLPTDIRLNMSMDSYRKALKIFHIRQALG